MIVVVLKIADPLLCGCWVVHGKGNGFEFSTLWDCHAFYHRVGSCIYDAGIDFLPIICVASGC